MFPYINLVFLPLWAFDPEEKTAEINLFNSKNYH